MISFVKNPIVLKCFISFIVHSLVVFGQTATFLSNFEDQNTNPNIGISVLIETGTSGGMYVVPNPHPDAVNSSAYVLKVFTEPGTGGRAEYTAARHETDEKTYIYTWKRFHPTDMFTDIDITGWVSLNQWKTWPCEYYGSGQYDFSDEICYGGGIFNDMRYEDPEIIDYMSRAAPNCNRNFYNLPHGYWSRFVLEIYWTNTTNGYYRIWRNDSLFGYSDNIKTLFNGFKEGTCDIYWATGLYTYWSKTGGNTQDSLIAYIDDIALYDIDNGYTINEVCPDCEAAPSVPSDSIVYKINVNLSSAQPDGYTNYIVSWRGDTSALNVSSTFGQSNNIDLYVWKGPSAISTSLDDECFPDAVINKSIVWSDTDTHQIHLKNLTPINTYTFRLLGATAHSSGTRGTQIWTTEKNKDTVFAANNTCNMAELSKLTPTENGELTINVQSLGNSAYINSIELVEYVGETMNIFFPNEKSPFSNTLLYHNQVKGILKVTSEIVPERITIYTFDGRKVFYTEEAKIIDISRLCKGVYIASIKTKDSLISGKIIVKY